MFTVERVDAGSGPQTQDLSKMDRELLSICARVLLMPVRTPTESAALRE